MVVIKALLLQKHWLNRSLWLKLAGDLFMGVGFIWLLLEVASFFCTPKLQSLLKSYPIVYLVLCLAYVLYRNFPRNNYTFKVTNRDSWIELRIGDVFKCKGDVVVPFNDHFDASIGGRAATAKTVQGSLIRERFDKDANKLQHAIDATLAQTPSLSPDSSGAYPMGTVLPIVISGGTAYLFASSGLTADIRARGTADNVKAILPDLWQYIKTRGNRHPLAVTAIGTGHSRTTLRREEVVEILVRTFISACADSTFCPKLTIVLHPSDILDHKVDFQYLVRFVGAQCEFARFD